MRNAYAIVGWSGLVLAAACTQAAGLSDLTFEAAGNAPSVGGMGGAAAVGGGGGSGAGGMGGELCTNGVDDDDDGAVDCEDADCGAYHCLDPAPIGWSGPVVAQIAASVAECPALAPTEVLFGGTGDFTTAPPSCSPCTCGAPQNVSCSIVAVEHFDDSDCSGLEGTVAPPTEGVCHTFGAFAAIDAVRGLDGEVASGGDCAPSGGTPSGAPGTYVNEARLCSSELGAGCSEGSVCAPVATPPYAPQACIMSAGDIACPAGPYSERRTVFDGVDDQRACSACNCGNPQNLACAGVSTLYSEDNCMGSSVAVQHDDACIVTSGGSSVLYTTMVTAGSCAPSGGVASGSMSQGDITTICCTP